MSRTASVETINRGERSHVHPTSKMIDPEKERGVDELFEEFTNWVTDTLTIQDNPYIRVITVFSGAEQ